MKTELIKEFKEHMIDCMLQNFKNDGFLAPVMFFMLEGKAEINVIPPEVINTKEGKEMVV